MFEIGTTDHWWEIAKRYPQLSNLYYTLKPLGYAHMITLIETFKPKTILEVGHGKGSFLFKIFGNDVEMWGLDDEVKDSLVLEKDLEWSRKEYPKVNFVKGLLGNNVKELPDNYFDLVCSVSVIEHIPEEQLPKVFEDTYRILKPGGIVSHSYDVYYRQNTKAVFDAFEKSKFEWLKSKDTMNIFWEEWLGKFEIEKMEKLFETIVFENPMEVVEKYMWYQSRDKRIAPINILTILSTARKSANGLISDYTGNQKNSTLIKKDLDFSNYDDLVTPDNFSEFTYSKKKHFDLFSKNNYDEKLFLRKIDPQYCDIMIYQYLLIYSFMTQNIRNKANILMIGSKDTFITDILKEEFEFHNIDTIDSLKDLSLSLGAKNLNNHNQKLDYSGDRLEKNYFDFIFSRSIYGGDLTESPERYINIIDNINYYLKPGGYCIFSIVLTWREPIVWAPEVLKKFFENEKVVNHFIPLLKAGVDSDLYVMSEKYYSDHWQSHTKLSYEKFGKPFSYNLLWKN